MGMAPALQQSQQALLQRLEVSEHEIVKLSTAAIIDPTSGDNRDLLQTLQVQQDAFCR
jgi:hypothetical protein